MKNEVKQQLNKVFLKGTLESKPHYSHKLYDDVFYEFMIKVPRLSEHSDIIPVTVPERRLGEMPEVGEPIALFGQFRSFNKMEGDRSRLMLTVFVREFTDPTIETTNPNLVEMCGFICKQPIFRTTPFCREICDVLLAVNRTYTKSDYIPCIAWGKFARELKECEIGQKITVTGRIQSRKYVKRFDEQHSEERTAYELSINSVVFEDKTDEVASTTNATV